MNEKGDGVEKEVRSGWENLNGKILKSCKREQENFWERPSKVDINFLF